MRRISSQHGFSLLEVVLVVAILAVVSAITFPLLQGALQKAQANGAAEALTAAIRDARMRAIATGWQYRVRAFDATGTVPNAFRIEGMNPVAVPPGVWPAAGTAGTRPFYGTNQTFEAYTTLGKDFRSAVLQIPAGGPTFIVVFDSRGQWATPCAPVGCQAQVRTPGGGLTTLTVSAAGAVQMVRQ